MDEKPGCIHPGDPEGCMNNLMLLALAVAALLGVVVRPIAWPRKEVR